MADQDSNANPTTSAAAFDPSASPPYWWATLAGAVIFTIYAITLSRTTAFWDTSEYITVAHILGIPHPPGNPTFVILARAWTVLLSPLGLPIAVTVNLFAALMSAGAHAFWFLVVYYILGFFSEERRFRLVGAGAAVLVSATAFTVWNQSDVNAKVYMVSLFTIAMLTWMAIRWKYHLKAGTGKDDKLLVLMVFILALSVGNHLMAFLVAPAIGVYILIVNPRTLLNWRLYAWSFVAALLGLSIHMVLPIRAALDPVINEASPTCPTIPSAVLSIVTFGKAGCHNLSAVLNRKQYDKPPLIPRLAPFRWQLLNYLQYFDWQWARAVDGTNTVFATLRIPFTMLFTGLGVWGATEQYKRNKETFWFFVTLFFTVSVALVFYMNFKYGYSLKPNLPFDDHEVRERDYFFIVSFSVWGLWAGMGIAALWRDMAHHLRVGMLKAAPVLGLAFLPLVINWNWASRAWDHSAQDWAYNLLMSCEPYAVLFTNGDNDTFPLWYEQEVMGVRRDVTVLVTSYLNTPWYAKQAEHITRPCPAGMTASDDWTLNFCQRRYTAATTTAAYVEDSAQAHGKVPIVVGHPIEEPTKTILPLSDSLIDRVAHSYAQLDHTQVLHLHNIVDTLQAGTILYPWQQYALTIINQVLGQRPVYFSSSGAAAGQLGLNGYLVREGLAFKLHDGPLPDSADPNIVEMPKGPDRQVTGAWLDLPRTANLVDHVFHHHTGIPDKWGHWPDRSTIGIPNYYFWTYLALAQAEVEKGNAKKATFYQGRADAWARLGS